MRVRMILALVAGTSVSLGVYTACGGDDSTGQKDGGADTSMPDTSVADTSVAPDASDASCYDADLNALFNQDASGRDAGAFGPCVACLQSKCGSAVMACNAECTCKDAIINFGGCIGAGTDPATCGMPLQSLFTDPGVAGILGCVLSSCNICVSAADGGKEAGPTDAGDGGG